ncbi:hypothetical protein D3C87_1694030 [compost metagenome]
MTQRQNIRQFNSGKVGERSRLVFIANLGRLQHLLVETVFLHLLVERLARNAERFIDRLQRPAMGSNLGGDEIALEGGNLFRQPAAVFLCSPARLP